MVEKYDVPSRLAEGRPAVENVQHYVWACHVLGYQHPDLTLHVAQIRDWYASEDGMDLAALHTDCLALDAAVGLTQDALAVQDRQLAALAGVWQGDGAEASEGFLRRHGDASRAAAAAIRTAAETFGALRENLWRAVDAKVENVVSVDSSAPGPRADWLAAAAAVTTGTGDRVAAAELVDQAVTPFVDNSVRTEWLAAMRTAMSAVADAYQRAAAEIAAEPRPVFEVPGGLGPTWSPPPARACDEDTHRTEQTVAPALPGLLGGTAAPAATAPAAWSAFPAGPPPIPTAPVAPAESVVPPVPPAAPLMPAMPSLGGMGSGMPAMGSGLSGLGQQLADTLGGLLGGGAEGLSEPPDLDPPNVEDPPDLEHPPDLAEPDDQSEDDDLPSEDDDLPADADQSEADERAGDELAGDEAAADEAPVEDSALAESSEPVEPQPCDAPNDPGETVAAPAPTTAPPSAEPLPPMDPPPADPVAAEQTPCAIAADELPQVGDPPE